MHIDPPLRIQTLSGDGKGRSFSGVVPAIATSNDLWSMGGNSEAVRPIMAVIVASSQESKPLVTNLRCGMKAVLSGGDLSGGSDAAHVCEFLKSANYVWSAPQYLSKLDAFAHHVYLKDVVDFIPPTLDEQQVRFLVMPSLGDIDQMVAQHGAEDVEDALSHVRMLGYPPRDLAQIGVTPRFVGLASIWASHLYRRTIFAVPQRLAFRAQLLLACLKAGVATMGRRSVKDSGFWRGDQNWWASAGVDFHSYVHPKTDLHPGVATLALGEFLERLLAEEVGKFDSKRRGKTPPRKVA